MASEIALVTYATAGIGKAIMAVPQVQRLLQTARFLVRNWGRLNVTSLRTLFVAHRVFPERDIWVLVESITDRRTRSYLEKAVSASLNTASRLKDDALRAHFGKVADLAVALRKVDAAMPEHYVPR